MLRAFKYRLSPTDEQTVLLNKHFGCVRFVYNWALNEKIKAYQTEAKSLSRFDLQKEVTKLKQSLGTEWLSEVNSQSLQLALLNLDSAYTRFFREKKGFPKFKSKHNRQSFGCPQNVKIHFENSCIYLPKIGWVKTIFSREFDGTIKTVTVSKTATGKIFASVLVETGEAVPAKEYPLQSMAIGVDVGLKDFATLSTGEKIANPKFLKKALKRLRMLSRQHSKKKKGSANREKSRIKLAKQHEKVINRRNDFLHKVSTRLIRENQTVCVENLNIQGMVKNHRLARAISDAAWATFISMLKYKAEWHGKNILQIGRFDPSSRLCTCGTVNHDLTLKDREWTCGACGAVHDRDILAANNIVRFAFQSQNLIGWGTPESTPAEMVSRQSVKQEAYTG